MNKFTYSYPTKVYFGEGVAAEALEQELPKVGKIVMLAYGGGSVKRSGVYDQLKGFLASRERGGGLFRHYAEPHLRQGAGRGPAGQKEQGGFHFGGGRRQRH